MLTDLESHRLSFSRSPSRYFVVEDPPRLTLVISSPTINVVSNEQFLLHSFAVAVEVVVDQQQREFVIDLMWAWSTRKWDWFFLKRILFHRQRNEQNCLLFSSLICAVLCMGKWLILLNRIERQTEQRKCQIYLFSFLFFFKKIESWKSKLIEIDEMHMQAKQKKNIIYSFVFIARRCWRCKISRISLFAKHVLRE